MMRSRSSALPRASYTQLGGLFYSTPRSIPVTSTQHFHIPGEPDPELRKEQTLVGTKIQGLQTPMQSCFLSAGPTSTPKRDVGGSGMLVSYRAQSTLNTPTKIKPFTLSTSIHGFSVERAQKVMEEHNRYRARRDSERERIKEEMLAERELYERAERIATERSRQKWRAAMALSPYCKSQLEGFARGLRAYTPSKDSRSSTPTMRTT